jgi:hypothetical protein
LNTINTTAPISIDELKKYFVNKDISYVIQYKDSPLKGKKLLTYLSNLEIPADLDLTGCSNDEFFELITEYLKLEMICNINFLEEAVITLLKEKVGLSNTAFFKDYIEQNESLVDSWLEKIHSLSLYNLYIIEAEEFKLFVESHPEDQTANSFTGINFVSLLKHSKTYDLFQAIDVSKLKFYKKYFQDYMFKGKNLFHYWATEHNPMFLLAYGITNNLVKGNEYVALVAESTQELKNASLV